jgi:Flp pilus assembly protein TadG
VRVSGPRVRLTKGCTEEGAAAVVLLVLTPVLFGLAGLVLDGGAELAARQRTADLAEQAARAGADRLDTNTLRATGTSTLDAAAARAAACAYAEVADPTISCTASLVPGPSGTQLQVRLRGHHGTVLLGLLGINQLRTDATATATAVTGIATPVQVGQETP